MSRTPPRTGPGMLDPSGPDTLGEALRFGIQLLRLGPSAAEAGVDARYLMAEATGLGPDRVPIETDRRLSHGEEEQFLYFVNERRKGLSIAHVVGHRLFWTRRFDVSRDVLVPRPETETLIELALSEPFRDVLDLGTGSGCIAVTLLAERPEAVGIATDLSPEALGVAEGNARRHGVLDRLGLEQSDWFESVGGDYDLIVSNPPYIAESEMAGLSIEVLAEPEVALTPGGDGLNAYRVIAAKARSHLSPGGRLIVEIGHTQGRAVADLFESAGLEDVRIHPDLNGKDRVVAARHSENGA